MAYWLKCIVIGIFTVSVFGPQLFGASSGAENTTVDMVVFSFDRPLQLYCLLESLEEYVSNIDQLYVLCRASNAQFKAAYDEVGQRFASVHFVWQGAEPKKDFKPLLMDIIEVSCAEYVLFGVDDNIVTDYVDLYACAQALQKTNAYAFYLRLGTNITYSYIRDIQLQLPRLTALHNDIFSFYFNESQSYWAYPNTVNMTLYRKITVQQAFASLSFHSPNRLEGVWHQKANLGVQGVRFNYSKMINIPLNIVQQDWDNKHEGELSTQELLDLWSGGLKIDRAPLAQIHASSCHMPIVPTFTTRS